MEIHSQKPEEINVPYEAEYTPVAKSPAVRTEEDVHIATAIDGMEPGIYGLKQLFVSFFGQTVVSSEVFTQYTKAIKRSEQIRKLSFSGDRPRFRVVPDPESLAGRNYIELETHLDDSIRRLYREYNVSAFGTAVLDQALDVKSLDDKQHDQLSQMIRYHPQIQSFNNDTTMHLFPPTLLQAWPEGPQTMLSHIAELAEAHHYPSARTLNWVVEHVVGQDAPRKLGRPLGDVISSISEALEVNSRYARLTPTNGRVAYEILPVGGSEDEFAPLKIALEKVVFGMEKIAQAEGAVPVRKKYIVNTVRRLDIDLSEWRQKTLETYIGVHPRLAQLGDRQEYTILPKKS